MCFFYFKQCFKKKKLAQENYLLNYEFWLNKLAKKKK